MRFHHSLRHISKAEPGKGTVQELRRAVAGELALDAYLELAISPLELPGIEAAVRGQPQIDATMGDEILWLVRLGPRLEIRRRADHRHAHVRPDAHRDHVLGDLLAAAHPGVITIRHDVAQPVL